jgi:hypothetical protein
MKPNTKLVSPHCPHPDEALRAVLHSKQGNLPALPPPPMRQFAAGDVVSAQTYVSARRPWLSRAARDSAARALLVGPIPASAPLRSTLVISPAVSAQAEHDGF